MKRFSTGAALILAVALAIALAGCLDTLSIPGPDNPADPSNPDTDSREPGRPTGLTAVVSDKFVELTWEMEDTVGIDHYRVYRWEVAVGEDEDFELLDTPEDLSYDDSDVGNGREYVYKVSAVNEHGLEGEASREVAVVPQVFAVTINQGALKTSSRTVTLRMSAGSGTDIMQVSNEPDLSGSQWEPYQPSYSWTLESGDGVKNVYVRFRDSADNESGTVTDDIELDTKAIIESVEEDTGGAELSAGDIIHFALTANELYGSAAVDLGSGAVEVTLFDDGTEGDSVADDGVYERDYTIEQGVEMVDSWVVGNFTDEVGNVAEPAVAEGMVTILDPPPAVELDVPVVVSETALALSWSQSGADDFASYKIYRASVPGVDTAPDRELIETVSDRTQTYMTDGDLEPSTTYYYAVYVFDEMGISTISNEVSGTTATNEPPEPVELYTPWALTGESTLEVSWSMNEDDDFMHYELIGWEQDPPAPPQTSEKRVLGRLSSRDETFFTHSSLNPTLVYWYEVAVVDSLGARSLSNQVSGSPGAK